MKDKKSRQAYEHHSGVRASGNKAYRQDAPCEASYVGEYQATYEQR